MKTCRCFYSMVSNPSHGPRALHRAPRGAQVGVFVALSMVFGCPAEETAGPNIAEVQTEDGEERTSVMPGIDEMADALVTLTARRWEGPRTAWPLERERPEPVASLRSEDLPLAVHGPPGILGPALEDLEEVAAYAIAGGFAVPFPDGSLGGGPSFDVYIQPTEALVEVHSDRPLGWSFLDGVTAHGVMDPAIPAGDRLACLAQLYGEAIALEQDPAEAPGWHRAFGAFLAWELTGRFGCADAIDRQQSDAGLPWIGAGEHTSGDGGAGGGLLLAMISQRHDGGDGAFVRELYQLARQRTWEGEQLRAAPDLWQALERSTEIAGDRFGSMMEGFSVVRGFLGEADANSPMRMLRGLGPGASAPVVFDLSLADLPHHTAAGPELQPFGTVFARVDVRGAPAQSRLRIWLRGEYGVEWGLTASRLNAAGRELARLSAPPRRHDRRSYLPMELTEDTTHVLVGITNLSHRLPDDDLPDASGRAFRLIFDLVGEGE